MSVRLADLTMTMKENLIDLATDGKLLKWNFTCKILTSFGEEKTRLSGADKRSFKMFTAIRIFLPTQTNVLFSCGEIACN